MLWITCSCKFAIDFTSSLAFMVQFSFVTRRDHRIALFLPSEHCLFLFPVTISSFSADLYLPNSFMTIPLREKLLWAISQLARELSHETSCHSWWVQLSAEPGGHLGKQRTTSLVLRERSSYSHLIWYRSICSQLRPSLLCIFYFTFFLSYRLPQSVDYVFFIYFFYP